MDLIGSAVFLIGLAMLFVGIVWATYPVSSLGMARRADGALLLVAAVTVMGLGWQLSPELQKSGTPKAAASASTPTPGSKAQPPKQKRISKSETLAKLSINSFHWKKDAFGTVMTANFVLYNGNTFPVKDLTITCVHTANSGTKIDRNTRTVYERIEADGYRSVSDMNMGFIHAAVSSSDCRITNFAPA